MRMRLAKGWVIVASSVLLLPIFAMAAAPIPGSVRTKAFSAKKAVAAKPVAKKSTAAPTKKVVTAKAAKKPVPSKTTAAAKKSVVPKKEAEDLNLSAVNNINAIDLLRSIPLEIQNYPAAQQLPEHFDSAVSVSSVLNSALPMLVRMEILRRSYGDLSVADRDQVLDALEKRHKLNEKDLQIGFDYGYAQLVYDHNKTGLFFLRKANDAFKTQFSSLAYGMAEAEADLTLENATVEQMTTRKLDTIYRLGDAVHRDAEKHESGFWPSFVRVIEKLKPVTAYDHFTRRDFSLVYVPYGNKVVPSLKPGETSQVLPLQHVSASTLLSNSMTTACDPTALNAVDDDAETSASHVVPATSSYKPSPSSATSNATGSPSMTASSVLKTPVASQSSSLGTPATIEPLDTNAAAPSILDIAMQTKRPNQAQAKSPEQTQSYDGKAAKNQFNDQSNKKKSSLDINTLQAKLGAQSASVNSNLGVAVAHKMANFGGTNAMIEFFPTKDPDRMRIRVFNQTGFPLLSFTSHANPSSIVEDLDGDGTLEIVARQYAYDPYEPVRVYRYTPCGFELDRKIFDYFR
jgi:hypothetical protein